MKKLAILVIASTNDGFYTFLINYIWSNLIEEVKYNKYVDIYLLYERNFKVSDFPKIPKENYIIDKNINYNNLVPYYLYDINGNRNIPSDDKNIYHHLAPHVISKVVYAFELLNMNYDVYLRINLTTIPNIPNILKYINNNKIINSGFSVFENELRSFLHLEQSKIEDFSHYKSNTFIAGTFMLFNKEEIKYIVDNKHLIRYDQVDDVALGLLLEKYDKIPDSYKWIGFNFHEIKKDKITDINYYKNILNTSDYNNALCIGLKYFPKEYIYIVKQIYDYILEKNMLHLNLIKIKGNGFRKKKISSLDVLFYTLGNFKMG